MIVDDQGRPLNEVRLSSSKGNLGHMAIWQECPKQEDGTKALSVLGV